MSTGTVKWFNDSKGFGFIKPDGGGEDLFAHFSEIQGSGFKTLKENQKVEFEVKEGPKGTAASSPIANPSRMRGSTMRSSSHAAPAWCANAGAGSSRTCSSTRSTIAGRRTPCSPARA